MNEATNRLLGEVIKDWQEFRQMYPQTNEVYDYLEKYPILLYIPLRNSLFSFVKVISYIENRIVNSASDVFDVRR